MLPHRANTRNANARNDNIVAPVSNHEVTNAKFLSAIQLLAKTVANQKNHQALINANINGASATTRIQYFVRMNPREYLRPKIGEDPQNFIDEIKEDYY